MAQGLGVSLLKTRLLALLAIALLCGAAVSIAGRLALSAWSCRSSFAVWCRSIYA